MKDFEAGIRNDLDRMLRAGCNNPTALTLMVLTETLGGFVRGTFEKRNGEKNWTKGLHLLGEDYREAHRQAGAPLYQTMRSVLVHTYVFCREIDGTLYQLDITNNPNVGIQGTEVPGLAIRGHTILMYTPSYARDLVAAFERQFNLVRGNAEARDALERAMASQRPSVQRLLKMGDPR